MTTEHPTQILGVVATSNIKADAWMFRDMLAFKDLLESTPDHFESRWLLSVHPRTLPDLVFGDPRSERLQLNHDVLDGFTVVPPQDLLQRFLCSLTRSLARVTHDGRIIIIICGHGEEDTGDIVFGPGCQDSISGNHYLLKRNVELYVEEAKLHSDQVLVVSTACYSGLWQSPHWTLLCAAEANKQSISLPTSHSGQVRGGIFTYAMYAESAHQDGIGLPYSFCNLDDGPPFIVVPAKADYQSDEDAMVSPRPTLSAAALWMEQFRKTMGGIANHTTFPFPLSTTARLPTRRFTACYQERLRVVPAVVSSGDLDDGDDRVSVAHTARTSTEAASSSLPILDPTTISQLEELCRRVLKCHFQNTGNAVPVITLALVVSKGEVATLTLEEQHILLAWLRGWSHDCARAERIAKELGWGITHPPRAEEWDRPHGSDEMNEAQTSGARIREEFGPRLRINRWSSGPGSWLAAAWRAAGSPVVEEASWKRAVAVSSAL